MCQGQPRFAHDVPVHTCSRSVGPASDGSAVGSGPARSLAKQFARRAGERVRRQGSDQKTGFIDPTDARRSSRSGWRAPTTRGQRSAGGSTTPGLWICGKPFRFPISSTCRHRRPASRVESRQRDVCRGQPGHRVADRRRRRARRRPTDRGRWCPAWAWGSGAGGKLRFGLTGPDDSKVVAAGDPGRRRQRATEGAGRDNGDARRPTAGRRRSCRRAWPAP